MADPITQKILDLMKKPEQIRNVGVAAHIDHGKCVAPGSRLALADGNIKTAEELFAESEKYGIKFDEKKDQIIYDTSKLGMNVFSLNKNTGEIEKKPIELAWKLSGGSVINVKLRNGFNISTTPEHK